MCLPRIRGDRPSRSFALPSSTLPPPHTRGSTLARPCLLALPVASPAYAGIDLSTRCALLASCSLPRIRGDRPLERFAQGIQIEPPPHTRGSTLLGWPQWPVPPASPAYAGIDPLRDYRRFEDVCLPRIPGDRPLLTDEEGFVSVIKATKSGEALFLTSFRGLSSEAAKRDREIKRLREKAK